ncbi:Fungalysin metallopeptidase (M36), partial [Rhizoctonia solani]
MGYPTSSSTNNSVANAVANVAMKGNKVISYGANFVKAKTIAPVATQITQESAVKAAESVTGATYNLHPIELQYFIKDTRWPNRGHVILAYVVEVENDETHEWYSVHVDSNSGEIASIADFTWRLTSYRVTPFTSQDLTDAGFTVVTDPFDKIASSDGRHHYNTITTTSTSGNNVLVYTGSTSITTSQSNPTNIYDYVYNSNISATQGTNPDAARVNVFYIVNMLHDLTTQHNFQQDNRRLGGLANDRVKVQVQSSLGSVITVLADGRPARIWLGVYSCGDSAYQNDMTAHEYMHGVNGRLTGGGTATCFQAFDAHVLDEGWADSLPNLIQRTNATDRDFVVGKWVYPTLLTLQQHDSLRGAQLWAIIWHEITVALIQKHGFSTNLFDLTLIYGNTIILHLTIDTLISQPCNLTFINARDAIIQADANRYSGANKCILWNAFAKRKLGYGATSAKANSETLPPGR